MKWHHLNLFQVAAAANQEGLGNDMARSCRSFRSCFADKKGEFLKGYRFVAAMNYVALFYFSDNSPACQPC